MRLTKAIGEKSTTGKTGLLTGLLTRCDSTKVWTGILIFIDKANCRSPNGVYLVSARTCRELNTALLVKLPFATHPPHLAKVRAIELGKFFDIC
jgi:hypothetical protein